MRRFGELARDTRVQARVSLRRVADELGLSAAYVSDIERGNRNPPTREIARTWARILGAGEDEFELTARRDRRAIELPINRERFDTTANEAAFALAREWQQLNDEDYQKILEVVHHRSEGKQDE
jgi:transcriptional regulator with XRE-family HTH domain